MDLNELYASLMGENPSQSFMEPGALEPAAQAQRARELAAQRVAQGVKPMTGGDLPLPKGREEGAFTHYLEEQGQSAPIDALMALGTGGAGTLARKAIQYAPRATAAAGGALATLLGTTDAGTGAEPPPVMTSEGHGERDPNSAEWWRKPLPPPPAPGKFNEPTLTPEELEQYKMPPVIASRNPDRVAAGDKRIKEMQDRRDKLLSDKTIRAKEVFDKEEEQKRADYEKMAAKQAAEDDTYHKANMSFRDAHPAISTILPAALGTLGAGIGYGARRGMSAFNDKVIGSLERAIGRGRSALDLPLGPEGAAVRSGAAKEISSGLGKEGVGKLVEPNPHLMTGAGLGMMTPGMVGGVEGALLPYEIDRNVLPEGSPGRREADDMGNWLPRGAMGALQGLTPSILSVKARVPVNSIPPKPEMEGILQALKGKDKVKTPRAKKAATSGLQGFPP